MVNLYKRSIFRAVANGPVGPAMAGPIIESAIKKNNCFFYFLIFILWLGLVGIINETVFFLDILFEPEKTQF